MGVTDAPEIERVQRLGKFQKPCAAVGEGVVRTAGLRAGAAAVVTALFSDAREIIAAIFIDVHVEITIVGIFFS